MSEELQTLNAAANGKLANKLIDKALQQSQPEEETSIPILPPNDTHVTLPAGYLNVVSGEVVTSAEVRELTGKDEEAIAREQSLGRQLNVILKRGVVSIGDIRADDTVLNSLLAADRDELLLGIYKATFGNPVELNGWCPKCETVHDVAFDLNTDIERKLLIEASDRVFEVKGRKATYRVHLPTGSAQRELNEIVDSATPAETASKLLEHCVIEINGMQVFSPEQVKNISITDRRAILREIGERNPGPKFGNQSVACPDCGTEVVVSVTLGSIFQLAF